ncbi:FkbM family methyltransferase [Aphanothece sacrum]|uniref:Lipopolysaccharide biosynthesis protein n=1 Tax=Aphanothece sacrum FPU1 TaxID=1920663 RepID=A0A401INX7_APHSA|nr:FkbM family methyltransferase [Aphanothece sacrum]GBF82953.1 lipopolysaccharide biosynthesis protein [Aphanothece sacrum FPU1]GBF86900.1 lipopolysaccharide biosynthesis protein [Aphanothece sacrum FPU3]
MQFFQKILLSIYSLVNKTGLLETPWFKKIFWSCYFLYKKYFEDPFFGLTKQYPDFFREGNILDIGANIGYTATIFSKAMTPGFRVYAFEPDQTNFLSLKEIIKIHKSIEKIIPIQAAVGETTGTIKLWHNENHHADHRIATEEYQKSGVNLTQVSSVPIWSVDKFVESELQNEVIKFIKIDVQGYELPVCLGMEKTLTANPDAVVALEYMPDSMSELGFVPEEIFHYFQERAYFMYIINQKGKLEIAEGKIIDQLVKKRGYIDLVFSQKNLNN